MDPITAGLVSRGALSALQIGLAMANRPGERPTYRIPGQVTESTNRARIEANAGTDTIQQSELGEINASAGQAARNVTRTARSGSDVVGAAAQIQGQTNAAKRQSSRDFGGRRMVNAGRLDRALSTEAAYADKAFDYNVNQPYQERMDRFNALLGSGAQNIMDTTDMGVNQALVKNYMGGNTPTDVSAGASGAGVINMDLVNWMTANQQPKLYSGMPQFQGRYGAMNFGGR